MHVWYERKWSLRFEPFWKTKQWYNLIQKDTHLPLILDLVTFLIFFKSSISPKDPFNFSLRSKHYKLKHIEIRSIPRSKIKYLSQFHRIDNGRKKSWKLYYKQYHILSVCLFVCFRSIIKRIKLQNRTVEG